LVWIEIADLISRYEPFLNSAMAVMPTARYRSRRFSMPRAAVYLTRASRMPLALNLRVMVDKAGLLF